jgi:hypothetical protein
VLTSGVRAQAQQQAAAGDGAPCFVAGGGAISARQQCLGGKLAQQKDAMAEGNLGVPAGAQFGDGAPAGGGDIMMISGAALTILPVFWSDDPLTDAQRNDVAREANRRYRKSFRPVSLNVGVVPVAGGQGATFALSGRF